MAAGPKLCVPGEKPAGRSREKGCLAADSPWSASPLPSLLGTMRSWHHSLSLPLPHPRLD